VSDLRIDNLGPWVVARCQDVGSKTNSTTPWTDAFCFAIALCYAITDLGALQGGFNTYPLAGIYQQATARADGTPNYGATFGLLAIILVSTILCTIGTVLTVRYLPLYFPLVVHAKLTITPSLN
jgi:hypothetical protein